MNRLNRLQMAQETVSIMESGSYVLPDGSVVSIAEPLAASCAQTWLYRPTDYERLQQEVKAQPGSYSTTMRVTNRTTLEAGRALSASYDNLACLNFASAKNPGGGFLSGSQAQEESLARSSGLYASLQTQPAFYDYHRQRSTCLYSDHAIYSPRVPVFRDDAGKLLASPWQCSFLTAAAVNAGAIRHNEPEREKDIVPVMEQRTRMVLSIAIQHRCQALVLGAWGCGVFQNDPTTIASIFARVLKEAPFQGQFKHIEFAVYDPSAAQSTYLAFEDELVST